MPESTGAFSPNVSDDVEDVATGVDGNQMPPGDDCAPPGSGDVGSSTRRCFAEISSTVVKVHSFQLRASLA